MKKLTLLLAALTVASAAYAKEVMPVAEVEAAPMLKVTSIGQYIEVDNTSGNEDIGQTVMLGNKLGLAYGDDWTFGLMARKGWSMDTAEGIHSKNHRLQLDATKHYEDYTLGMSWRQEKDSDRFLATTSYNYGMFSGDLMAGYKFMNNDANDYLYAEGNPLKVKVGPATLGYYFEYSKYNGDEPTDNDTTLLQRVKLSAPLYSNEKLAVSGTYYYQFAEDVKLENGDRDVENNKHSVKLAATYAMTDDLSLNGSYEYCFNNYDIHEGDKTADDYYGELVIGWTYKF